MTHTRLSAVAATAFGGGAETNSVGGVAPRVVESAPGVENRRPAALATSRLDVRSLRAG